MQKARWSTTVAAAALLALPVAAFAQSTQGTTPQQNPPSQSQPPSQQPPSQQPQTQQPQTQTQQPQAGQIDANAAKTHLSEARDSLSQLTSLPEAARLQGDARTQVSQLISNFNALITTQSDWRSAYGKLDANLTALLGPDAAADQPVGTSGSAAGTSQVDPAIRAKLVEFRTHLKEFEKAAGGGTSTSTAASGDATAAAGSMPPSTPTPTTSNPSNPASAANPANPSTPDSRATGTSGVSPSSPTATMDPADRAQAAGQVNAAGNADAQKELDAISSILNKSKTGTLTRAQTTQLKQHVEALRSLLNQR